MSQSIREHLEQFKGHQTTVEFFDGDIVKGKIGELSEGTIKAMGFVVRYSAITIEDKVEDTPIKNIYKVSTEKEDGSIVELVNDDKMMKMATDMVNKGK